MPIRMLRPFRVRQYRVLMGALTLSLFGAGIWLVAVIWQVIELGGGPGEVSVVATAAGIGMVGAVLVGGITADRVPQRRILIAIETAKVLIAATTGTLAVNGWIELWQLAIAAMMLGIAEGFFYPAYSALLPSILPEDDLLAANGAEGVLRPALMQAAGPAVASGAIAVWSPGIAFLMVAVVQLAALGGLYLLRPTPVSRARAVPGHPFIDLWRDFAGGFRYMMTTPWLLSTMLFFCVLILLVMGPVEVLLPFAVREQTGGGAGSFALVLGAFGVGGATGAIAISAVRLPRRYLTVMNVMWGAGCLPLAVIGYTGELWVMVIALFAFGFTFSAATVIWGTLLQRRVPKEMLGRVSSLDFFVSFALLPVSMAIAGPVGETIGFAPAFLAAGLLPIALAVAAIVVPRLHHDELRHPLDLVPSRPLPGTPLI